jgi:hypothetical protein
VALPEQRAVVGRAQDRDGKALRHPERQRSDQEIQRESACGRGLPDIDDAIAAGQHDQHRPRVRGS